MKAKVKFLAFSFIALIFCTSCGGEASQAQPWQQPTQQWTVAGSGFTGAGVDVASLLRTLDEIAELERSGSWIQGMALTESTIRERIGDYAGAVAAAFKELSWAFGLGLIQREEVEQGLLNVLSANNNEIVYTATNAILAFFRGQWNEAAAALEPLFGHLELYEPDGFGRWMLLVCALEKDGENRRAVVAYRSIRARYAQFPEFWFRGARNFSGTIAAEFAENSINLAPGGPFAAESRSILAVHSGLRAEDGTAIRTMREIDAVISQSINSGNPQFLDSLLPLIGLPDNPYTLYAVGALRALNGIPRFHDYFASHAAVASGRLAERLSFISRG